MRKSKLFLAIKLPSSWIDSKPRPSRPNANTMIRNITMIRGNLGPRRLVAQRTPFAIASQPQPLRLQQLRGMASLSSSPSASSSTLREQLARKVRWPPPKPHKHVLLAALLRDAVYEDVCIDRTETEISFIPRHGRRRTIKTPKKPNTHTADEQTTKWYLSRVKVMTSLWLTLI